MERPSLLVLWMIVAPYSRIWDGHFDVRTVVTGLSARSRPRLTHDMLNQRGLLVSLIISWTSLSQMGTIGWDSSTGKWIGGTNRDISITSTATVWGITSDRYSRISLKRIYQELSFGTGASTHMVGHLRVACADACRESNTIFLKVRRWWLINCPTFSRISLWVPSGIKVSNSSSLRGQWGGSGAGNPSRPWTVESITDPAELDGLDVTDDSWDSSDGLAWRRLEEAGEPMLCWFGVKRVGVVECDSKEGVSGMTWSQKKKKKRKNSRRWGRRNKKEEKWMKVCFVLCVYLGTVQSRWGPAWHHSQRY